MIYFDVLFAAIAIGVAASLGGMIWPFHRGVLGVLLNVVTAVVGSVAFMLASYAVLPWGSHRDTPVRLGLSAVGALVALGIAHLLWTRRKPTPERYSEPHPPAPSARGL